MVDNGCSVDGTKHYFFVTPCTYTYTYIYLFIYHYQCTIDKGSVENYIYIYGVQLVIEIN